MIERSDNSAAAARLTHKSMSELMLRTQQDNHLNPKFPDAVSWFGMISACCFLEYASSRPLRKEHPVGDRGKKRFVFTSTANSRSDFR